MGMKRVLSYPVDIYTYDCQIEYYEYYEFSGEFLWFWMSHTGYVHGRCLGDGHDGLFKLGVF